MSEDKRVVEADQGIYQKERRRQKKIRKLRADIVKVNLQNMFKEKEIKKLEEVYMLNDKEFALNKGLLKEIGIDSVSSQKKLLHSFSTI